MDITGEVRKARAGFSTFYGEHGYKKFLAQKVLEQSELLRVVRVFGRSFGPLLNKTLPADSGLRLQLALFDHEASLTQVPERETGAESREDTDVDTLIYFPGCSANYLYPEIVNACESLSAFLGYTLMIPNGLVCCGAAMDAAGDPETAKKHAKHNILVLEKTTGSIVVSCSSCFAHLKRYADILSEDPLWKERAEYVTERLIEISQFLDANLPEVVEVCSDVAVEGKVNVFYHDPCHLRNECNITREPRNVLKRFSTLNLLELEDGPQCCGHGGLFHLGAPELSAAIRDDLAGKVLAMKPDIITSSCSGCLMQWKIALSAQGVKLPVVHLAELVSLAKAGDLSF